MIGIGFCNVKMKSRYYFKFSYRHILYSGTAKVTESNNRKNLKKDAVYFHPEDNRKTRNPKEKNF